MKSLFTVISVLSVAVGAQAVEVCSAYNLNYFTGPELTCTNATDQLVKLPNIKEFDNNPEKQMVEIIKILESSGYKLRSQSDARLLFVKD